MRHDPWLTEISPDDIEAAMQRKAAREALIVEQAAEITRLRAELATARREGMEAMAEKIAGWHENAAKELEAMEREFRMIAENLDPDAMQSAMRCAQGASQNRQRAAAIRTAAGEGK